MATHLAPKDFFDQVARYGSVTSDEAKAVAHALAEVVEQGLRRDGRVRIRGLGSFKVGEVRAHRGHNPRTHEPLELHEMRRVLFRPLPEVASLVNFRHAHEAAQTVEIPIESQHLRFVAAPRRKPRARVAVLCTLAGLAVLIVVLGRALISHTAKPEVSTSRPVVQTPAPTPTPLEPTPPKPTPPSATATQKHVVERGDTLSTLSQKYLGAEALWPILLTLNRESVRHPDMLEVGVTVATLRARQGRDQESLRVDEKQLMAAGCMLAEQAYASYPKRAAHFRRLAAQYLQP